MKNITDVPAHIEKKSAAGTLSAVRPTFYELDGESGQLKNEPEKR